jgi:hypothetical protein
MIKLFWLTYFIIWLQTCLYFAKLIVPYRRTLGTEIEELREADPSNPNPPDSVGKKLIRWTFKGIKVWPVFIQLFSILS